MRAKFIAILSQKAVIMLLISICISSMCFSQSKHQGSLDYLKFTNGINNFRLGSYLTVAQAKDLMYLEGNDGKPDADSCITYEYNPDNQLKLDDDVNLDHICVRTYQNKIINIYVFFDRTVGYKVLSKFLKRYGLFTAKPDDYLDIYNWDSSTVGLSLRYHLDSDLGMAVYTCIGIKDEIAAKKAKAQAQIPMLSSNK